MHTGASGIKQLRSSQGILTLRAEWDKRCSYLAQRIYRWYRGEILPSVDHLYMMSLLLEMHMEELIVPLGREDGRRETKAVNVSGVESDGKHGKAQDAPEQ